MFFEFDEFGKTDLTYIANPIKALIVLFASFTRDDIRFVPNWKIEFK